MVLNLVHVRVAGLEDVGGGEAEKGQKEAAAVCVWAWTGLVIIQTEYGQIQCGFPEVSLTRLADCEGESAFTACQ